MVSITLKCQETCKIVGCSENLKITCMTVKVDIRDPGITTVGVPTVIDFDNFKVLEMVEIGVSVEKLFQCTYGIFLNCLKNFFHIGASNGSLLSWSPQYFQGSTMTTTGTV